MSKAKLLAAREFIQEKRYSEARSLLETMPDEPTAQKWLAKLDKVATPARRPARHSLLSPSPPPPTAQSASGSGNPQASIIQQHLLNNRYAEARQVASASNDPQAPDWLKRIDAAEDEHKTERFKSRSRSQVIGCMVVIAILVVVVGGGIYWYMTVLKPFNDDMRRCINTTINADDLEECFDAAATARAQ